MSVKALEGVVEDGQIRLPPDIRLPDQTMVYILIPDAQARPHIATPRLARIAKPTRTDKKSSAGRGRTGSS